MPKHIKTPTERKRDHWEYLLQKAKFTGVKSDVAKSFEEFIKDELNKHQELYRRLSLL